MRAAAVWLPPARVRAAVVMIFLTSAKGGMASIPRKRSSRAFSSVSVRPWGAGQADNAGKSSRVRLSRPPLTAWVIMACSSRMLPGNA